ncbi:MAG: MFS transporter [Gammaproteobacteria bacterium]|nr:MFS transporter [Gammaproteobacteria bacterium]
MSASALQTRDHSTIALVSIAHGVTHWMHALVFIVLPMVREEFGLDYTDIGLFGAIYYGASTVVNVTAGPVTDLVQRRERFQLLSLGLLVIALFAISLSYSYITFCLAAALVAVGNSLWHPAAIPYLANRFEAHRGYALALHSALSNVGDSLAPAIIGAMLSGWFLVQLHWREVAVLNILPALLILPPILALVARDRLTASAGGVGRGGLGRYFRGLWQQLRSRMVLGIALMAGLRATAQGGIRIFLPLYVVDSMGLSLGVAGMALAALSLGGVLAAIPAGIASDRFGRRRIVMVSLAVSSVLLLALTLVRDELALIVGISLVGFSIFALRPVMLSWMMDVMPGEMRGAGTNLMFTTQSLVQVVNPLIAGFFADRFGLVSVFYYFAGMLLLANAVAFMLPAERTAESGTERA